MSVKIRLLRVGRKKIPCYRIIVVDSRKRRDGAYLEQLGIYHPNQQPARIEIKQDRALHWLSVGAQPSDTVRSLLSSEGIMARFDLGKRDVTAEKTEEIVQKIKTDAAARTSRRTASAKKKADPAPAETPAESADKTTEKVPAE